MTTFAELADSGALSFSDGYRTKREELAESGFRVLRVADVQHGRIMLEGNDFVSAEYASQVGAKIAQDGDILLTTKGTIGRVAAVEGLGDERVVYSPQLFFFRVPDRALCHEVTCGTGSPHPARSVRSVSIRGTLTWPRT